RARLGQRAGAQREPGDEADPVARAVGAHLLAPALGQVVAVLDGGHREDLRRRLDVGDLRLAEPGVANEALVEQRLYGVELFVARDLRIDPVELPEVEPIDAQVTQALVRLLDKVLRSPERHPAVRAGARQAALVAMRRSP